MVIQAELRQTSDLEVFDQHVGARGKLAHDAATVLALKIQLDRAFAAIGGMKIGGADMLSVDAFDERRSPDARVIARTRAFDLDHVRPEVGQHLARQGPARMRASSRT